MISKMAKVHITGRLNQEKYISDNKINSFALHHSEAVQ